MASTNRKQQIRDYMRQHGANHTRAAREIDSQPAPPALLWPSLKYGQKVRFGEDRTSSTVRASSADGRFVALNQPSNLPQFRTGLYTVIDFALGIRGTATSWGVGFTTDEECREAIKAFERGVERENGISTTKITSQISFRNWVWLRFTDRQVDPQTQALLPWLRFVMACAPARNYNDHNPRTQAELDKTRYEVSWAARAMDS